LQGKEQNTSHLVGHIEGFCKKWSYLKTPTKESDKTHCPSC
jgi:hypothetical protein